MSRRSHLIVGGEAETATLLSRCLFNSELRVFGFATRHLNLSVASRYYRKESFSCRLQACD